jgi:YesN/AraC family two-component response regulator
VTPNYLGVQFTKKMGISFSDYLNTMRLRYACNLLDSTDLAVKEIAFASGYNSVEHFGYTFKKILGDSPLNYKKR